MTLWFLLLIIHGYGPTAVAPVIGPFHSEPACQAALKDIKADILAQNARASTLYQSYVYGRCVRDPL